MPFNGKVAFVTGASSGIGRACGVRFAAEGASVFAVARREGRLREAFDDYAPADLCDAGQVRAAVEKCIDTFGRIDYLINAASSCPPFITGRLSPD